MRFRLNRQLVGVATTVALLLALVAGVALFWGPAPSAVPAAANSSVAASQGDYQLSPPNEAEPAGAGVGETSPAGNAPGFTDFREDRSADAPVSSRDYTSDLGTDYDPFVFGSSQPRYSPAEPDPVEDRSGSSAGPADPGVGPSEFLPGEAGTSPLPAATPDALEAPGTACRPLAGCNR